MVAKALQLYLALVHSLVGGVVIVILSLAICLAILLWARRSGHAERWPVFIVSGTLTIVVVLIYGLAVLTGWWSGGYFRAPLLLQMVTLLPLSMVAWVGWLLGYGWLAAHSRHPLLVYALIGLFMVLAVAVADRAELSGGMLVVADDGATWIDALIAVLVMLTPVLVFEAIRRDLARDTLP